MCPAISESAIEIIEPADLDAAILSERARGIPVRTIAQRFYLTRAQVEQALDRCATAVNERERARVLVVELERLGRLYELFVPRAEKGDVASAALLLKIDERIASLWGLNSPAGSRTDAVKLIEASQPQQGSTMALMKILDRLVGERPEAPAQTLAPVDFD